MNRHRDALLAAALVALPCLSGCAIQPQDTDDPAANEDPLAVDTVRAITTISYAPNSFVIGNAYPGWTDDVQGNPQFSAGPGNPHGTEYRWGYLYGEGFDRCAWVGEAEIGEGPRSTGSKCGAPQQIDTPYFLATYTNGMHNQLAGDGSLTTMHYAGSGCSDVFGYGNVEPWKTPATRHNSLGAIPNGKPLRWRYVSRDGEWVLVRDPAPEPDQPSWFFVHRGCVSLANTN